MESGTDVRVQPAAAAELMRRHPEVEQVGFVRFSDSPEEPVKADLRMAGGEFCGNAALCAAALWCIEKDPDAGTDPVNVRLHVSGTSRPVEVMLRKEADGSFRACIDSPAALNITEREFRFGSICEELPVVSLEGIAHIIIRPDSAFFSLREDPETAEAVLRIWCGELAAEGLGLMLLAGEGEEYSLTPYVYIPGSGTFFRENSCASGSAAAAMALAAQSGKAVSSRS